jgi:2-succinyl-5-enolpyruvyl-6-hydroxy-3-cyclohexene-1-carboxylate synthase
LSAAFGAAAAGGRVVVHLGDVASAHDLGAPAVRAPRLACGDIVLVEQPRRRHLHFLPVASQRDAYEQHVATPTA